MKTSWAYMYEGEIESHTTQIRIPASKSDADTSKWLKNNFFVHKTLNFKAGFLFLMG